MAITVRGVVQGVGFRPFVYRTAHQRGLNGWVQNEADAVRLEVSGPASDVADFLDALRDGAPPQARIDSARVRGIAAALRPGLVRNHFRDPPVARRDLHPQVGARRVPRAAADHPGRSGDLRRLS